MAKATNNSSQKSMGLRKLGPITVDSVEKEYGFKLKKATPDMSLSTYMERESLPEMARVLRTVEKEIGSTKKN